MYIRSCTILFFFLHGINILFNSFVYLLDYSFYIRLIFYLAKDPISIDSFSAKALALKRGYKNIFNYF